LAQSLNLLLPTKPYLEVMKSKILLLMFSFCAYLANLTGQTMGLDQASAHCQNPRFHRKVAQMLRKSIPLLDVDTLHQMPEKPLLLDAREAVEYAISRLPSAQHCGFNDFKVENWLQEPKDRPIVVYCSIGYRSEKIGERLREAGFTQVYNLYGSIFEWVNRGYALEDAQGQPTQQVHTYNRKWSRWVKDDAAKKIW
jgi:rhodanese-related sulfurtransferase